MENVKGVYITIGIVISLITLYLCAMVWANNTAIGYEETIKNAQSQIQIQEKREYDLVTKLVQVVEANSTFEANTQMGITKARTSLKNNDVNGAMVAINAVAEQYPDLKATASYTQLMTELSTSENLKSQYRSTYNDNVQEYEQFTRRFPSSSLLSATGYKIIQFDYLQFNETDLPTNLFGNP